MADPTCPLSYFVRGQARIVQRGYGCGATGGRCVPGDKCEKRVEDARGADESEED